MTSLPFAPAAFDLVTTGYGLRNVPDLTAAIGEIARVLKPGGRLLSLDFNRPEPARDPRGLSLVSDRRRRDAWLGAASRSGHVSLHPGIDPPLPGRAWRGRAVAGPGLLERARDAGAVRPYELAPRRALALTSAFPQADEWSGPAIGRVHRCAVSDMALVDSLLSAMVRADGDALVMHVGERPYVVTQAGTLDLSTHGLNLGAMTGMLQQLLPAEQQSSLEEFGAVEHTLPSLGDDRFTLVAARGGDDIWIEIRRRRTSASARADSGELRRDPADLSAGASAQAEAASAAKAGPRAAVAELEPIAEPEPEVEPHVEPVVVAEIEVPIPEMVAATIELIEPVEPVEPVEPRVSNVSIRFRKAPPGPRRSGRRPDSDASTGIRLRSIRFGDRSRSRDRPRRLARPADPDRRPRRRRNADRARGGHGSRSKRLGRSRCRAFVAPIAAEVHQREPAESAAPTVLRRAEARPRGNCFSRQPAR